MKRMFTVKMPDSVATLINAQADSALIALLHGPDHVPSRHVELGRAIGDELERHGVDDGAARAPADEEAEHHVDDEGPQPRRLVRAARQQGLQARGDGVKQGGERRRRRRTRHRQRRLAQREGGADVEVGEQHRVHLARGERLLRGERHRGGKWGWL